MSRTLSRSHYAEMFGPTVGDRVRLADTELFIAIERDFTMYGDEVKFGGGKVIRDGMGQSPMHTSRDGTPDVVITNAVILDHWGIVKADVGIKNGRICGIGKAGNPLLMDGVSPELVIGAGTEVIAGEGKILTAGGIDSHIHFICPQQITEAFASGVTTNVIEVPPQRVALVIDEMQHVRLVDDRLRLEPAVGRANRFDPAPNRAGLPARINARGRLLRDSRFGPRALRGNRDPLRARSLGRLGVDGDGLGTRGVDCVGLLAPKNADDRKKYEGGRSKTRMAVHRRVPC